MIKNISTLDFLVYIPSLTKDDTPVLPSHIGCERIVCMQDPEE